MRTAAHEMPETPRVPLLSWVVPPIAVPALLGAMILTYAFYRGVVL